MAGITTGLSPAVAQATTAVDGIVISDEESPEVEVATVTDAGPTPDTPGVIIGSDDRIALRGTRTFPFRATTLITFADAAGNGSRCTGFMISADTVATAGHCVADGGNATFYPRSTYRISAGAEGASRPYGTCRAVALATSVTWFNVGTTASDYGAIKLDCQVGSTTGWLGISPMESAVGTSVFTDGYPGDKPLTHWMSMGRVTASTSSLLFYDNDTVGGQSGSPVWRSGTRCGICAVAIHTTGSSIAPFNHGTRITGSAHSFLNAIIAL